MVQTGVRENHLLVNNLPIDFHASGQGNIYYVMLGPFHSTINFVEILLLAQPAIFFNLLFKNLPLLGYFTRNVFSLPPHLLLLFPYVTLLFQPCNKPQTQIKAIIN